MGNNLPNLPQAACGRKELLQEVSGRFGPVTVCKIADSNQYLDCRNCCYSDLSQSDVIYSLRPITPPPGIGGDVQESYCEYQ